MIRMIQSRSARQAKAYFSDALLKSDYYVRDQEMAGHWQGLLAQRLGLKGLADKEGFFALCENRHPLTGKPLTPRTKEERTTGYDINFHCPKSVSLLHVLSKDDHILFAFEESVSETMRDIEADSKTRVRKGGTYDDRPTEELAWAHFIHQTARPVDGFAPDPHLHSHCFVFNATWDEKEQRVKAGQFRDIKRDMPYYQAVFHKRLADKLSGLGYRIEKTEKSFEIAGVPGPVMELFSKRTDEIGRIAKEKGITDAKELGELGARSRSKKQKGATMAELKEQWLQQIESLEVKDAGNMEEALRFKGKDPNPLPGISAKTCVDYALLHCFERVSVMAERRILETACRHGLGYLSVTVEEIAQVFKNDKRILKVKEKSRTLCTTKDVLQEEKRMVDLARQGQGKLMPLYSEPPEINLKGPQATAVFHVLTTPHRVSIIRGAAGAGKTTLMKEAVSKMEEAGKKVFIIAPTAQASRGVLKDEGFKDAETVAKFLNDKTLQQNVQGQVIWVDEAGLLGVKDMTALLSIATKQNARLILGGDTRQHASVVRGDALRILNTVAGIPAAEVNKIYRQKNEHYRQVVEDLSKGDIAGAFEKLESLNFIRTVSPSNPNKPLVDDYIEALKKGKTALIISPTHAQGDAVTKEIRGRLKAEGAIGKKEIMVQQFVNLNLTEAEKGDARNLKPGQRVQFNQNLPGLRRGSLWVIERSPDEQLHLINEVGERKDFPAGKKISFEVYQQREIPLAKGDRLRITRNGFDADKKRLNNGQMLEVVSVSKKGEIILRNTVSEASYRVHSTFGHLAHAHCITSYAAQGKTVDEVFISQPAGTFAATDAKQFYVSVSRGREQARIYTDDKEALLANAKEMGERQSAIELLQKGKSQEDFVMQMERNEKPKPPRTKEKEITHAKNRENYEPEI